MSYSIHISLFGAVPQILNRNIGKQRRNHPVAGFGFRLGNLDIQALGINIANQLMLMLPYVLTILALVTASRKAEFPSAYTVPYSRLER